MSSLKQRTKKRGGMRGKKLERNIEDLSEEEKRK
jgi:hypothetical protein